MLKLIQCEAASSATIAFAAAASVIVLIYYTTLNIQIMKKLRTYAIKIAVINSTQMYG